MTEFLQRELIGSKFILFQVLYSMAKVATQCPVTSNALHFGGGPSKVGTAVKRKTPSELRVSCQVTISLYIQFWYIQPFELRLSLCTIGVIYVRNLLDKKREI